MHWTILAPAAAAVVAAAELASIVRARRRGDEPTLTLTEGLAMASCTIGAGVIAATMPVAAGVFIVVLPILAVRDVRRRRRAQLKAREDSKQLGE